MNRRNLTSCKLSHSVIEWSENSPAQRLLCNGLSQLDCFQTTTCQAFDPSSVVFGRKDDRVQATRLRKSDTYVGFFSVLGPGRPKKPDDDDGGSSAASSIAEMRVKPARKTPQQVKAESAAKKIKVG